MPSSANQRFGAIAESEFITECLRRDFEPHQPITPMPWDFIVTCPNGTLKVQVKSTTKTQRYDNDYKVMVSSGHDTKTPISAQVDVVACFVQPIESWWIIPQEKINTVRTIRLTSCKTSKSKYRAFLNNWNLFYEEEKNI